MIRINRNLMIFKSTSLEKNCFVTFYYKAHLSNLSFSQALKNHIKTNPSFFLVTKKNLNGQVLSSIIIVLIFSHILLFFVCDKNLINYKTSQESSDRDKHFNWISFWTVLCYIYPLLNLKLIFIIISFNFSRRSHKKDAALFLLFLVNSKYKILYKNNLFLISFISWN